DRSTLPPLRASRCPGRRGARQAAGRMCFRGRALAWPGRGAASTAGLRTRLSGPWREGSRLPFRLIPGAGAGSLRLVRGQGSFVRGAGFREPAFELGGARPFLVEEPLYLGELGAEVAEAYLPPELAHKPRQHGRNGPDGRGGEHDDG